MLILFNTFFFFPPEAPMNWILAGMYQCAWLGMGWQQGFVTRWHIVRARRQYDITVVHWNLGGEDDESWKWVWIYRCWLAEPPVRSQAAGARHAVFGQRPAVANRMSRCSTKAGCWAFWSLCIGWITYCERGEPKARGSHHAPVSLSLFWMACASFCKTWEVNTTFQSDIVGVWK